MHSMSLRATVSVRTLEPNVLFLACSGLPHVICSSTTSQQHVAAATDGSSTRKFSVVGALFQFLETELTIEFRLLRIDQAKWTF